MQIKLENRLALVTGGSGALGTAICTYLARAGAKVVAAYASPDQAAAEALQNALRSEGLNLELAVVDVADTEACAAAIGDIESRYAPVDIIVNGAGITRDSSLKSMTAMQWQQVLRVNLDSVFNTTRPVIEGMLARGWGRIVNISSVNGQKGQFGQTNYSAAKAGMHGFTMALAQEVARKGVTVNTVSPGYIDSPMIRAVPENIRTKILESIPAARFGQPQDIAAAVTFLCSEHAAFINGANLPVNGAQYTSA
jgi:acetoacetyl-CoA reductase